MKMVGNFGMFIAVRAFLDVLKVVEAEADDLARIADRLEKLETLERHTGRGRCAHGEVGERLEIALVLLQHRAKFARQLGIGSLQVDDLISLDNAKVRGAIQLESDNLHKVSNSVLVCIGGIQADGTGSMS